MTLLISTFDACLAAALLAWPSPNSSLARQHVPNELPLQHVPNELPLQRPQDPTQYTFFFPHLKFPLSMTMSPRMLD